MVAATVWHATILLLLFLSIIIVLAINKEIVMQIRRRWYNSTSNTGFVMRFRETKAESYYIEGKQLYDEEMYEEAIEAFSQSISWACHPSWVYYYRGICYYHTYQWQLAIEDLEFFSSSYADCAIGFYVYALCLAAVRKYDFALAMVERAIKIEPLPEYIRSRKEIKEQLDIQFEKDLQNGNYAMVYR